MKWVALALMLVGCAEMQRPLTAEPPAELSSGNVADPLAAIAALAARDFEGQGASLGGRPAATALAAARLEWLAGEGGPGGRLSGVPQSFRFGLQRGVEETRASLGIRPEARPAQVVPALIEVARQVSRGDGLSANPVFRPDPPPLMRRLSEPGLQPSAALATAALRDELARQHEERRSDPRAMFDSPGMGLTTFGLGGNTDR